MKHHRSTGAGSDEGMLHTFVMDHCFPSQGSQQGTRVLVIKETKTMAPVRSWSRTKVPMNTLSKAVVDFMSGCGCGRAILKSDGERCDCCFSGSSEEFKTE